MTAQQIRCPHCNNMFLAPAGSVGHVVACPHCQGQLRVPGQVAAQPPMVPRPAAAPPPPRPPAAMAQPSVAVARPAATPASPPAPPAGAPQASTGASPAAPLINDPARSTASGQLMRRRKSSNNVVMYVAVPIAILFVFGAIGVIALIANRKGDSAEAEKLANQVVGEFRSLASVLESVKDEKTAQQAARRVEQVVGNIRELDKKYRKLRITKAQDREIQRKSEAELEKLEPRLKKATESALVNSDGSPVLLQALGELGELAKLAR